MGPSSCETLPGLWDPQLGHPWTMGSPGHPHCATPSQGNSGLGDTPPPPRVVGCTHVCGTPRFWDPVGCWKMGVVLGTQSCGGVSPEPLLLQGKVQRGSWGAAGVSSIRGVVSGSCWRVRAGR